MPTDAHQVARVAVEARRLLSAFLQREVNWVAVTQLSRLQQTSGCVTCEIAASKRPQPWTAIKPGQAEAVPTSMQNAHSKMAGHQRLAARLTSKPLVLQWQVAESRNGASQNDGMMHRTASAHRQACLSSGAVTAGCHSGTQRTHSLLQHSLDCRHLPLEPVLLAVLQHDTSRA